VTRIYGLIGYPLGHSFSPAYFSQKFTALGLNQCEYELFPLEDLRGLRDWLLLKPEILGLNVTIPHKEAILPLLDWIDPVAEKIGAVNTLRIRHLAQGMWLEGYNTDIRGFEKSLRAFIGSQKPSALVFGSGGSSKAVGYVLDQLGIGYVQVSRRPKGKAISYANISPELASNCKLWINTTPVGMSPNEAAQLPLPYDWLTKQHYCCDLIYNPEKTMFLASAEARGAHIQNGLPMLYAQADAAWEIWDAGDHSNAWMALEG
jgi:shikimate dehydrogenase